MTRARDISNVITDADLAGDIDVDGTANLDVVDIDGALTQDGGAVFNETGASVDFRVESDEDINALVVDGSANRVGIGEATPASKLEITAGGNSHGLLRLNESDASNLAGYMQFDSNGTNKANVQNANNAGIHLCVGTGGSITFTNLGYTAANALDDYEEGSWTPVLGGASSDPTVSYTGNNAGAYTKVGNVVHVVGRVNTTSVSGGSGTALIRGLPFATSGARNAGAIGYISNVSFSTGYTTFGLNPDSNASTIRIVQSGSGIGGATVSIGVIGNTFDLTFSHTYRV